MSDVTAEEFTTFGALLRFLRQRAGLTLRQLGEQAGYTDSLLSRLEKNERLPNLKWVEETLVPALLIDDPVLASRLVALALSARREGQSADDSATLRSATPLSSFVGRRKELEDLVAVLGRHRLVTLFGTGGSGKTRLAIEVAQHYRQQHALEAWFIDLSACHEPAAVTHTITASLHIIHAPADPTAAIVRFFKDRPALLVIDNAEHLIATCASLVDQLLRACPELSILVTSRESLRLSGEHVWWVSPLSMPQCDEMDSMSKESLHQFEAIELFVERARDAGNDRATALDAEALRKVARICWRLDGLPLAIELAAARTASMSIDDILAHMDDRFAFLTAGNRLAPERQMSLEQAIDWSHVLLGTHEQRIFRRLAIFAGGWTMQMAEQVCADDASDAQNVMRLVAALVEKSMVVFGVDAWGNARYTLLETLRAYALKKLDQAGEQRLISERHAHCMVRMVESVELKLFGPEQIDVLRAHENNLDNIRVALAWLLDHGEYSSALQMAGALRRFWQTRGHVSEGRMWLSRALPHKNSAPIDIRARAVFTAAVLANYQNDTQASTTLAEEAVSLARQCDDKWVAGQILVGMIDRDQSHGTVMEWRQRVANVQAIAHALDNPWLMGDAHHKCAAVEVVSGDYEAALQHFQQSERELLKAGDGIYATVTQVWIGALLFDRGDCVLARLRYLNALQHMQRTGLDLSEYIAISYCLQGLAYISGIEQFPERMAQLLGAVELEREWLGGMANHWFPLLDMQAGAARYEALAGTPVDLNLFSYFWQKGRRRTLAHSVAYALAVPESEIQRI